MKNKSVVKIKGDSVDTEALRHWMKSDLGSRIKWLEEMIRFDNKVKKVSTK